MPCCIHPKTVPAADIDRPPSACHSAGAAHGISPSRAVWRQAARGRGVGALVPEIAADGILAHRPAF